MNLEKFICPECGSRRALDAWFVDGPLIEGDAWSGVLQMLRCEQCRSIIPAHLAELWDDLSVEQAQKEWREIYRNSQPQWD